MEEERKKQVAGALAVLVTATQGPDEEFMKILDEYIDGKISLDEIEAEIDLKLKMKNDCKKAG